MNIVLASEMSTNLCVRTCARFCVASKKPSRTQRVQASPSDGLSRSLHLASEVARLSGVPIGRPGCLGGLRRVFRGPQCAPLSVPLSGPLVTHYAPTNLLGSVRCRGKRFRGRQQGLPAKRPLIYWARVGERLCGARGGTHWARAEISGGGFWRVQQGRMSENGCRPHRVFSMVSHFAPGCPELAVPAYGLLSAL